MSFASSRSHSTLLRTLCATSALLGVVCPFTSPGVEAADEQRPTPYRFNKTTLSKGEFFEPTEMAILPNLDVLITQRRGEILHYDQADNAIYRVGFLDVYSSSDAPGVNAEEGVLGIAADPDFPDNHFIYIFYSPAEKSVNRLSRFVFNDRQLDMDSEKIVLEFHSQRDICCHTGGSLAFGPDRLLYLSTGDNSTPFDEPDAEFVTQGFAPLNDLPDKQQYDARRSAANTNDLRGKILRIRILPNGEYEIPEGNLFPETEETRPEIYTMGHRNPYRISVDPTNGDLYWGDVGPDARSDSPDRGPRGYDEMNRATEAGNYGWPLFVGDSFPYHEFKYETGESAAAFDPQQPINDSANNTGLRVLPPARAPFIWYSYAESEQFPELQSGGRNAMAGPIFRKELYPEETRLPDYYDNAVVMYDWIRNLFLAVSFGQDNEIDSIEPFLEEMDFSGPINVEMGPDGRLYVLEYGSGWFQKNPDSGLSRIDYIQGNLSPRIEGVSIVRTTGRTPFEVEASVEATDHEGDALAYVWQVGDLTVETQEPAVNAKLTDPGSYQLSVTVRDSAGASSTSEPIALYAGNVQPRLQLRIDGNQSFYFPEVPVRYSVEIEDDAEVIPSNAFVAASMERWAPATPVGHLVVSPAEEGRALVAASTCAACHSPDTPSIGPSFMDIAKRYASAADAETRLSNSILHGSSGTWGRASMPAHPGFNESQLNKIVASVLSHQPKNAGQASLPLEGLVEAGRLSDDPWKRQLVIRARYTDTPAPDLLPLSASATVALLPSRLVRYDFGTTGFATEGPSLAYQERTAELVLEDVDLQGIRSITLQHDRKIAGPLALSVRVDCADGPIIGKASLIDGAQAKVNLLALENPSASQDLYLQFHFETTPEEEALLQAVEFHP